MAGQLKYCLIGMTFFSLSTFANSERICAKVWEQLPLGTSFQNGELYSVVNSADRKSSRVQIKDADNKILKEISIPRPIEYLLPFESAGNGFVYNSEGKLFHYDSVKKREQEIQTTNPNASFCASNRKTSLLLTPCGSEGAATVYDLKTQKQIEIPKSKNTAQSGQTIVYAESTEAEGSFTKVSISDFSTGKKQSLDIPKSRSMQFMTDSHLRIQPAGEAPQIHLVKIKGQWKKIVDSKERLLSGVLSNGDILYTNLKRKDGKDIPITGSNIQDYILTTDVYDNSGLNKKASVNGYYASNFYGGRGITRMEIPQKFGAFSESDFRKITSGQRVNPRVESKDFIPISESGKWAIKSDASKNESFLVNLATGKSIRVPNLANGSIQEGENGVNLSVRGANGGPVIVNTKTGKVRYFQGDAYTVFDKNFETWYQYRSQLEKLKNVCLPNSIKVIEDDCDCLFKNANKDSQSPLGSNLDAVKDIAVETLCQFPLFDSQAWDKITPAITKGEISKKQARLYLKRFQKYGGYNPEIHLPILTAILQSDLVEKNPEMVTETLKTLSIGNPETVRKFYQFLKIDQRMPATNTVDKSNQCKSESDLRLVDRKIEALKNIAATVGRTTTIEDWIEYKPFKADLQKLPKQQRDAIVDGIAESLSQKAGNSPELAGVFQSKLYYFSKKYALDFVGDKAKSATDLAMAVKGGKSIPIILGSGSLQDTSQSKFEDSINLTNSYGFSFKVLDPIPIPENPKVGDKISKAISWRYEGQKYSAETTSTVLEPLGNLIPKDKSPNYPALKRDGKLTGMMIIGNNLSAGHSDVVDEYLNYYQNQGFEFKEAKPIDAIEFFKKSVQSGEVDYLIKEAHSDGDERNLFRANKYGKLFEGTLTKKDGVKEVVYLIAADQAKQDSELISNQEFGSWVRGRGKDQPLVYLNASCNSKRKVISEITAAHSSNFVPIPSVTSVLTFRNSEENSERQILQSFRSGESYDDIRAGLQKTKGYKKGRDHFIFPDEKGYDEEIRANLRTNLDIEVKVKDSSGKEVHIDESIDH